jgi:hypothetical protein
MVGEGVQPGTWPSLIALGKVGGLEGVRARDLAPTSNQHFPSGLHSFSEALHGVYIPLMGCARGSIAERFCCIVRRTSRTSDAVSWLASPSLRFEPGRARRPSLAKFSLDGKQRATWNQAEKSSRAARHVLIVVPMLALVWPHADKTYEAQHQRRGATI